MPDVTGWTLVMAVQAVQTEILRLRGMPGENVVPGDELLLVEAFEQGVIGRCRP